MKRNKSLISGAAALACLLLLMLANAACTRDAFDMPSAAGPDAGTPGTRPLAITVNDGGLGSTAQTRAEENGYRTVFTEGDRIGLYVVKDGTVIKSNLPLTLHEGKWTLPANASQLFYSPGTSYYAYYPYKDNNDMNGMISPGSEDFFGTLAETWIPNPNQSTYANYTASDLMTALGECTLIEDGNYTLHFSMEHRMALVFFQFPTIRYTYTERIGDRDIPKSYYRYTMVGTPFLPENPSTGRYLMHPQKPLGINLIYYFYTQTTTTIDPSELKLQPGRYTIHKVAGGVVKEEKRSLKEGDYYMKDGSILPAEDVGNAMSDEDKNNCLGVVFWVGEKETRSGERLHWTGTGQWGGDRLLMRDHPDCVHGVVVALHDASPDKKRWSSVSDEIYAWGNEYYSNFTAEEREDVILIRRSNTSFGYCQTRFLGLFKAKKDATTEAYDAILDYASSHPAPYGCSGWFFPGEYEVLAMAKTKLSGVVGDGKFIINKLNSMLSKAGGVHLKEDYYWTNSDFGEKAYAVALSSSDFRVKYFPKTDAYYVRAVLAF